MGAGWAMSQGAGTRSRPAAAPARQALLVRRPLRSPADRPPAPLVAGPPLVRRALSPRLTARAAILVDARNGRVVWALRPHRRLSIASTTKIMTALLALQRLRLAQVVRVDPLVTRVPLVREGLRAHERVRAWKLLDGLLIYSGNDDALALAVASAGSRRVFVARMNEEARSLRDDYADARRLLNLGFQSRR